MEYLKALFGDKPLTYDEFVAAIGAAKDIKLANLASGQYVDKSKLATEEGKVATLTTQLGEANATIEKFKGLDVEGIQRAADEWRTKHETDTKALNDKLAEQDYAYAVREATAAMQFTSEGAKKAFIADLTAKKLPVQDGKLLGLSDFVTVYKEADPGAFAPEGGVPKLVLGGKKPPLADVTAEQYKKMGYAERLKLKTEQPELYKELTAKD